MNISTCFASPEIFFNSSVLTVFFLPNNTDLLFIFQPNLEQTG